MVTGRPPFQIHHPEPPPTVPRVVYPLLPWRRVRTLGDMDRTVGWMLGLCWIGRRLGRGLKLVGGSVGRELGVVGLRPA